MPSPELVHSSDNALRQHRPHPGLLLVAIAALLFSSQFIILVLCNERNERIPMSVLCLRMLGRSILTAVACLAPFVLLSQGYQAALGVRRRFSKGMCAWYFVFLMNLPPVFGWVMPLSPHALFYCCFSDPFLYSFTIGLARGEISGRVETLIALLLIFAFVGHLFAGRRRQPEPDRIGFVILFAELAFQLASGRTGPLSWLDI